MLSVIAGNSGMELAMWVVLIATGLGILVRLLTSLRGKTDIDKLATAVTRPVLVDILPLIILSWLTVLDGTHFLMLIWYYVAAVLVIIRVLMQLASMLRK